MENETQKLALITGASRGIGHGVLTKLMQDNPKMIFVGTATTEKSADNITNYIKDNGAQGCGMCLNLADFSSIEIFIKKIISEYGRAPDVLVNNAGMTKDNLLMRMKPDEWHDVIDVNLNANFYLVKLVVRHMMKQRWGRIVNVSSIVASTGNLGQANYVSAKAGVIGMTKALALELATRNITVNAVSPGFVNTDMTAKLDDNIKDNLLARIPMGRMAEIEDIASPIAFLISDAANYITGSTIHVNGGMYMD